MCAHIDKNWLRLTIFQVGDSLMMYLLRYTSLFLPLPRNKHHQITGFPISDLCKKPSQCMPNSKVQHHPVENNGITLITLVIKLNSVYSDLFA